MQSLNIKERKLLELQNTQTRHPLSILQKKMSKFKTPPPQKKKNEKKKSCNVYKIEGAHLQCMNNHYAKFDYKRMKTVGVTDYTNQTSPTHFGWKNCLSSTPVKMRKYLSNVHKIGGIHLQCVNNHFEYKGMKTF